MDLGPLLPAAALESKLIDGICYKDEVRALMLALKALTQTLPYHMIT